jgi:calcineurin-like phosphoesterase family protein
MITHFYSDPHFGHANIIQYASRPFDSIEEHDATLIEFYRDIVGPNDVVCWCGDVSLYKTPDEVSELLHSLPGNKILIRGNHDGSHNKCLRMGFDVVLDVLHIRLSGKNLTVSHKPLKKGQYDDYNVHGHIHSEAQRNGTHIHVGVDAWEYGPVSVEEIERLIDEP